MNVGVAWECAVPLSESWRSIEKLMSATKQDVLTLRCKVAVCGEAESGKTALTQMFVSKATVFPKNYKMTAGVDVCTAKVEIPQTKTKTIVELYIHDTGGNDIFADDIKKYWDSLSSCLIVFDVTSRSSFMACSKWLALVRQKSVSTSKKMRNIVLVGNKTDLTGRRVVSREEAAELALSEELEYCETSSLPPGFGLDDPFEVVARKFYDSYEETRQAFTGLG